MPTPTPHPPQGTTTAIPFPLKGAALVAKDDDLLAFLKQQMKDFGGSVALEPNFWILFAIPVANPKRNALAADLLKQANFTYYTGEAEGDAWVLYYVSTEFRAKAVFWLADLIKVLSGRFRDASPSQQAMIKELPDSDTPHRVARSMADMHAKGEMPVGAIRDPQVVRGLLDCLHARQSLYFSAFQILLENQLIDMLVFSRKLVDEDVQLGNEIVKGAISQDPFFQNRQTAASNIRNQLLKFRIINPLDQQKHSYAGNPYVSFTETRLYGEEVIIRVDGIDKNISRDDFVASIRLLRKHIYRGTKIEEVNTQTPWITELTAQPLRFIKQQMDGKKDVMPLDYLYMLERAVDPDFQVP